MAKNGQVNILNPNQSIHPEGVEKESGWAFRVYTEGENNTKMKQVFETYQKMHQNQCVEYVNNRREHWLKFDKFRGTILEALDRLNEVVDEADPDTTEPNIIHAYQTAEGIRKKYPDLDWFHLTGLIHDLGKIMALYGEPHWSNGGDTFPMGCKFAPSIPYRSLTFHGNPDLKNEKYSTKYGIYSPNCGLRNVMMSWGHDEYMYNVLKYNNTTLPEEALYIIRFHSFYAWHHSGDYTHLTDNYDNEMLPWLREFSKFDVYTKKDATPDIEKLKPYYQSLIDKYIPGKLWW